VPPSRNPSSTRPTSSVSSTISKDRSVDDLSPPAQRPVWASFRSSFAPFNLANQRSNSVAYDSKLLVKQRLGNRVCLPIRFRYNELSAVTLIWPVLVTNRRCGTEKCWAHQRKSLISPIACDCATKQGYWGRGYKRMNYSASAPADGLGSRE
jgi:hypothetical protein